MKENYYAIIMAGGVGSRFWPMSRTRLPKQFLDVLNRNETLIQTTFTRLAKVVPENNILVITNEAYLGLVAEQLPQLKPEQILAEPAARNTATCLAYGVFKIAEKNPDALIIASPSDHHIQDEERFAADLENALCAAEERPIIMTLGVKPTRPDTGYGYIQYKEKTKSSRGYYEVKLFTEKPTLEIAQTFIDSGDFVWNGGIFIFSAATMLSAFNRYLPDTFELFNGIKKHFYHRDEAQKIAEIYPQCKSISIDYGVMEKANNVYVLPVDFGWSDLGTWTSLYNESRPDANGNVTSRDVKLAIYNAEDNLVQTRSPKLVVLKDVKDLIIVDSGDVLLICPKSQEQYIREIVADLKKVKINAAYI